MKHYEAMEAIKTGQAITVDENGIRLINFELDFKVFGIAAHDIKKGDKVLYSPFESTSDVLVSFPKSKYANIYRSRNSFWQFI